MMEQGMPAPAAAPAQGKSPTDMLVAIDADLAKVADMVSTTQAPDQAKELFAQASAMYRQGLEALMGGGQSPMQGQQQPIEAGNAKVQQVL
jgi:hypothetical protein